ncbi:MAG: hypothetical protein JNG83_09535 [Opitutaceae bacterium]|nr:hypothetical protein [Opitutaceae bacterium]
MPPALRRLLPFAAGLTLLAAVGGAAAPDPAPAVAVFLLAGQSNLAGRGAASGLPADYPRASDRVRLDYVCSFGAKGAGGPPEPHRSGGWVPVRPSPKHASTPEGHFGPEIGFARILADRQPARPIALIKHGRGATSLAVDWDPAAASGPRHYAEFVAQARAALRRLAAEGARVELAGFVWCQGEADSTRPDWAEAYGRNLAALIARVREDFAAPGLPVLVVLSGDNPADPRRRHAAVVRAAQRAVVARDPRAALVAGDDLTLFDDVHYDAPSQRELGERLGRAYVEKFGW